MYLCYVQYLQKVSQNKMKLDTNLKLTIISKTKTNQRTKTAGALIPLSDTFSYSLNVHVKIRLVDLS